MRYTYTIKATNAAIAAVGAELPDAIRMAIRRAGAAPRTHKPTAEIRFTTELASQYVAVADGIEAIHTGLSIVAVKG